VVALGTLRTTLQNTSLALWDFLPDKNHLMFYAGQKGKPWPPFKVEVSDKYEKHHLGNSGGRSPLKSAEGRIHELGCFLSPFSSYVLNISSC